MKHMKMKYEEEVSRMEQETVRLVTSTDEQKDKTESFKQELRNTESKDSEAMMKIKRDQIEA